MKESRTRAENILPQHPICTLTILLPDYTGLLPSLIHTSNNIKKETDKIPIGVKLVHLKFYIFIIYCNLGILLLSL